MIEPSSPPESHSAGSTARYDTMLYALAVELTRDAADANAAAAAWADDFVVISEFSEHEGPIAVQLLPSSAAASRVDVSDFVVRIMAVDVNRGSDSELGKFNKDSQVLCDVDLPLKGSGGDGRVERWSAYVHHLTLLDVHARGYVRPVCLSYLSREPRKLATLFLALSREFTLAADTLKRGNYDLFRRDVERRIADLEFTRLRRRDAPPDSRFSPSAPLGPALDEHLDELRLVLSRLRTTLSAFVAAGSLSAAAAAPSDEREPSPPPSALAAAEAEADAVEAARSFGAEVTELDLYGDVHDDDVTRLAAADAVKRVDRMRELRDSLDHQQTSTKPGGGDASDSFLATHVAPLNAAVHTPMLAIAEAARSLSSSAAAAAAAAPPSVATPLVTTIGFDESSAAAAAAPAAAAAVAAAGAYQPQVIKSLQRAERFDERLRDIATICDAWHASAIEHMARTRRHFARPAIALALERSDEKLMSAPSTLLSFGGAMTVNFDLACDAASLGAAEPSLFLERRQAVPEAATTALAMSRRPSAENLLYGDAHNQARGEILPNLPPLGNPNTIECFADALWSSAIASGAGHGLLRVVRRCSFSRHLVASLLRSRPVVVRGATRVADLVRAVVRAFAVFVPRAGVFDGGDAPSAVVLWRGASSPPLRLSDLATLRLVGVASEQTLPSSVETHVSIYDIEEQTLLAPPYEGAVAHASGGGSGGDSGSDSGSSGSMRSIQRRSAAAAAAAASLSGRAGGPGASQVVGVVDDILSTHRVWPDEATYLAFVHHTLFELAAKASLYYHLCCVEPLSLGRSGSYGSTVAAADDGGGGGSGGGGELDDDTDAESLSGAATPVQRAQRSGLARLSMHLLSGAASLSNQAYYNSGNLSAQSSGFVDDPSAALAALGSPLTRSNARDTFFRRMYVPDCDVDIVVNLAELIKLQQEADKRPANAAPTIRLDYATRVTFRNTSAVAAPAAKARSPHTSMSRF